MRANQQKDPNMAKMRYKKNKTTEREKRESERMKQTIKMDGWRERMKKMYCRFYDL